MSDPLGDGGGAGSAGTDRAEQGGHERLHGVPLGQASTEKEGQSPQALGLGRPTPESGAALQSALELALKLVVEGGILLSGSQ